VPGELHRRLDSTGVWAARRASACTTRTLHRPVVSWLGPRDVSLSFSPAFALTHEGSPFCFALAYSTRSPDLEARWPVLRRPACGLPSYLQPQPSRLLGVVFGESFVPAGSEIAGAGIAVPSPTRLAEKPEATAGDQALSAKLRRVPRRQGHWPGEKHGRLICTAGCPSAE